MMILRSSSPSPFGRKVKLALGILGLESEVTIEKADPTVAPPAVARIDYPVVAGKWFYLDDDPTGGLQAFAVLASRRPLPSYTWHVR